MKNKIIILSLVFVLVLTVFATVPADESIREFYSCNGTSTIFTFNIPCRSADDIKVYKQLIATGAQTPLRRDVDYTIAHTGASYLEGGVVTISPAPTPVYKVVIAREIAQTQETQSGSVNPISIEASNDKLTRQIQDLQNRINRSMRLPEAERDVSMVLPPIEARKGLGLAFDANGLPYAAATYDYGTYTYIKNYFTVGVNDVNFVVLDEDDFASDSNVFPPTQQSTKEYITSGTIVMTNKTLTGASIVSPTITNPVINTSISGTAVLDENDMASNSATKIATQRSIKAYTDNLIAGISTNNIKVGIYTGNSEATQAITGVGFQPDAVLIVYHGAYAGIVFKTAAMGDYAFLTNATYTTGLVVSLDADGFTVGTGWINTTDYVYSYIALKSDS